MSFKGPLKYFESEIQHVAFMFWVHLLTCTYIVGLYIFINYTEFGLFVSVFYCNNNKQILQYV